MNTAQEEADVRKPSRRKGAGRVIFFIGFALLLIAIVFSFSISLVSSYSGAEVPISDYSGIISLIFTAELLLILAGLAAVVLPEGPSKDGIWVMMVGPYAGPN